MKTVNITLEAVAEKIGILILFIAGELQTAVCLELVVVGLFYFVRSTFDRAHSSPGMIPTKNEEIEEESIYVRVSN